MQQPRKGEEEPSVGESKGMPHNISSSWEVLEAREGGEEKLGNRRRDDTDAEGDASGEEEVCTAVLCF